MARDSVAVRKEGGMVQGRRLTLQEVFGSALEEGWIVIAANVYTPDYVTGVARAMYE